MNSEENQMKASIDEDADLENYAMQIASASVMPMVLKAANELGVLDVINKAGPGALLSPSQIASQIVPQNKPETHLILDRILSLLTSYSILTCSLQTSDHDGHNHRVYGLAPVAKFFVQDQGGSLSLLLEMIQDKVMLNMWFHLKDAVLEGGFPFDRAYGMTAVQYIGKDAKFAETFKGSMRDFNPLFMHRILEIYKGFEGLKSLVDVGGGDGSILNTIVSKYPNIKAINYDLAPVIEKSPSYPGIEHVVGDMFMHIPEGEAIFLKWMLHSWDDEHCLKILKNCCAALPVNGKVIAVDMVIPETPQANLATKSLLQFDLFMMSMNARGERTRREFESLANAAGFSHIQVPCCAYNFSVVEFYKNM